MLKKMMRVEVQNAARYAGSEEYPYTVARVSDGELWFWGAYAGEEEAREAALEVGGVVLLPVE